MSDSMHALVAQYGYVFVALLVGAEGVGIPLPGETALLTAAGLAARGHLSIIGVIVAAAVGVALGGAGGYWIGHTAGQNVVTRYGRWVGITSDRLDHTRTFFARYGARAVLVGRFVPVVRILTGLAAGITDMPFARFAVYNTLAGVVWYSGCWATSLAEICLGSSSGWAGPVSCSLVSPRPPAWALWCGGNTERRKEESRGERVRD